MLPTLSARTTFSGKNIVSKSRRLSQGLLELLGDTGTKHCHSYFIPYRRMWKGAIKQMKNMCPTLRHNSTNWLLVFKVTAFALGTVVIYGVFPTQVFTVTAHGIITKQIKMNGASVCITLRLLEVRWDSDSDVPLANNRSISSWRSIHIPKFNIWQITVLKTRRTRGEIRTAHLQNTALPLDKPARHNLVINDSDDWWPF
jgi:hypothetical protein